MKTFLYGHNKTFIVLNLNLNYLDYSTIGLVERYV